MKNLVLATLAGLAVLICGAAAIPVAAQTFTILATFPKTGTPTGRGPLVQGMDGNFYAESTSGGTKRDGTIFQVTPQGVWKIIYSFCSQTGCDDGIYPYGLLLGNDGILYGITTGAGGSTGYGTVFSITTSGKLTTLYTFCSLNNCADGGNPQALALAADGNLYGATNHGGANNLGTIFEITPQGKLTTIYNICNTAGCPIGVPIGMVQGTNGNFYGATETGGTEEDGSLFELTPAGSLTLLFSFDFFDGYTPYTGPILAANGDFYGTTPFGGNESQNGQASYGTIYQLTPEGGFDSIVKFSCSASDCPDGSNPDSQLEAATDGNLYGTAGGPPDSADATILQITLEGKVTNLYTFCKQPSCLDGENPTALLQATDGNFYGMTGAGGSAGWGTIFRLSMGFPPFVKLLPGSGKIGSAVTIFGNGLSGATEVAFNKKAAPFTVVSDTEIKATVPSGATTGKVVVTTPGGALTSNVNFRILQ